MKRARIGDLGFPDMTTVVPAKKRGSVVVSHYEVSPMDSLTSLFHGPGQYCPPGKYAVLRVDGQVMMSDTRMERTSNLEVVEKAKGQVLVAGLGLGMILHPIAAKAGVKEILVLEKSRDVIKMISPTIPRKVEVVCVDVFDWEPLEKQWNTIYFDIWPTISQDNLLEMSVLHSKFRKRLAPGGWMGSWCRDFLREEKRKRRQQAIRSDWLR